MNTRRWPRFATLPLASTVLLAASAVAPAESQNPTDDAWPNLRTQYYGERELTIADTAAFTLEAPSNTPDPTATALTLRFGAADIGHIRQLRVFIDNNPSPVASTFDFAEGARVAEIGMRVRVDRWTSIRAIAETTDGQLQMHSTWVNAAGGCSAAPSPAAGGTLGEIRFHNTADGRSLQIAIRHPNNSGFQIDPLSGNPIPPHYVSHIRFSSNGHPIMDVDAGISLSENPTLRIASDSALPAPLSVEVTDSHDAHFNANWHGSAGAGETISDAAVTPR